MEKKRERKKRKEIERERDKGGDQIDWLTAT